MSSQDSTGTPARAGNIEVPWADLYRENGARISRPTRDELSAGAKAMARAMGRRRVEADVLILASLRRALRDPAGLIAEMTRIERSRYRVRAKDVKSSALT